MFKKNFFFGVLCLIFCADTFALCCYQSAKNIAITDISPYLGINGGYMNGPWKVRAPRVRNFPTYGTRKGLFAGLSGRICPGLYLATELFGNKNSTQSSFRGIPGSGFVGKVKSNYDYGLSFISGYMFAPSSILYGRMGVDIANIEWVQTPGPINSGRASDTKNVYGAQFGFGYQQAIFQRLFVRAEYVFSSYQSRIIFGNKISPQNNQYNLGLLYKFC